MRVHFGPFVLDSGSRQLLRSDHAVHLSPKAFDILEILVARRPNVVGKDVLLNEVWAGKVVEEANLAMAVGEIRKALGDDSKSPTLVITVARRGYRFAARGDDLDAGVRPDAQDGGYPRWWLTWGDKTLPLIQGENIIGRHPASNVWLNGASVSRTHACVVVTSAGVTVEDRGSRNGTFVEGNRLEGSHLLVDGTTVTFGSETATYREWSDEAALGTEPVREKRRR
ncbi:MAG: winged helix-turn-helix domain-containing protein [Acidobacteria bacterium]|nr:winged helix-turn-helix domain-containing protein [Acidobacteriota bacterium]